MNTTADTGPMQSKSPGWQVRFLFGQAGPWGSRPKSRWKWIGKGELSADKEYLTIVGRRHRPFWLSAQQAIRVGLQQVRNVVAEGRLLQFEVQLESRLLGQLTFKNNDDFRNAFLAAGVITKRWTIKAL